MIEADSLSKKFGDFLALDGVTFRIAAGEIIGLLGPNGAGKTTTLRILTGTLSATGGRATVGGWDLATTPRQAKRLIGYLPENAPLYPELTVEETLAFAAGIHTVPRAERSGRIEDTLSKTGLTDVRRRPVANLSKGFRQRVGIAMALVHEPNVLILDEPMIGLDPRQIIEFRDLIRSHRPNRAILLSSHILQDVSALCDRILILSRGRIVKDQKMEGMSTTELETLFLDAIAH